MSFRKTRSTRSYRPCADPFLSRIVGGIYSVIKSKAPVTTAEYGDRYTLIGPLNHQSVRP